MPEHHKLTFPDADDEDESTSFVDWTVWATGFRPFFLGGALLAAVLIPLWIFAFFGGVSIGGPMGPVGWHTHEMVFGFTPAIIAGFLLTAVPRWTGVDTPTGGLLAGLFGLWVAGRIAMVGTDFIPYPVAAIIDLAFLPFLAVAISIPIGRDWTLRNLGFIPLLFGLAAANGVFHLDHLGILDGWAWTGIEAGLGLIIVIIAIVGGRVIPFFTASGLGIETADRGRILDGVALAAAVAWLMGLVVDSGHDWTGGLALIAGLAQLARMWGWKATKSQSVPLLWVLHAGYTFVAVGLVLFGLHILAGFGTRSIAYHALGVGAIGTLCLGMMARVALGHTGRPLEAPRPVVWAFAAMIAAAVVRFALPWVDAGLYDASLWISALLWTGGWIAYLAVYTPILVRPRADGRPG